MAGLVLMRVGNPVSSSQKTNTAAKQEPWLSCPLGGAPGREEVTVTSACQSVSPRAPHLLTSTMPGGVHVLQTARTPGGSDPY